MALVGHSYAGMVIAGVAQLVPERIAHLVYLDAFVPLDGQKVFDILAGTEARATDITWAGRKIRVITPPSPRVFGVDDPADLAWMEPQLTPRPYGCYAELIKIISAKTTAIPKTYLLAEIQAGGDLQKVHESAFETAREGGWTCKKVTGPHDMMVTHPRELADGLSAMQRL